MLSPDPSLPPSWTVSSTGVPAISVHDVTKVYQERSAQRVRALDRLSLTVEPGEIFGLLGQNGAGKTTLLRILTTLIRPTAGSVSLLGVDVVRNAYEARKLICAVLQENAVEVYLSVEDNLTTYARFHSIPRHTISRRAAQAIEQFGLGEYRKQKVIDLSGGLKRRVQVAKVFMVDKPVVFLDEATTGMDPINKRATLDTIRDQAKQGRTIFLTTHILEEAEELCNRIAIIDHGRVVATGTPDMIKSLATTVVDIRVTYSSMTDGAIEELSRYPLKRLRYHHMTVDLSVSAHDVSPFQVLETLGRLGTVLTFEVSSGTLEDAFIELLGKGNPLTRNQRP